MPSDPTVHAPSAPLLVHERDTDQYGYAAFEGNYYWARAAGGKRSSCCSMRALEDLSAAGLRGRVPAAAAGRQEPPLQSRGTAAPPAHAPKLPAQLTAGGAATAGPARKSSPIWITPSRLPGRIAIASCALWTLSRRVPPGVFLETLQLALRYRVVARETLERIAWFCLSQGEHPLPDVEVDESYRQRPAYEEGCLTDEPDLSCYDDRPLDERPSDPSESEDQDG